MRKIIELNNPDNYLKENQLVRLVKAKIYWDAEWQEYIAKFYMLDGQTKEAWNYHTADKADAISTARYELGLEE